MRPMSSCDNSSAPKHSPNTKGQRSFASVVRRTTVLTTIAIAVLSFAAAGSNAAGFSFVESVKEFFGIAPAQTSLLIAQPEELRSVQTKRTLAPLAGPTDVSYTAMTTIVFPAEPVATISPAVAGLTFSQISRGSGVLTGAAAGSISGSGFSGSLATNITGSKWYKFSITSDASTTFTVSNLSIVSRVSNATGSPNDSVQYSIGGSSPTTVIGSFTPTTTGTAYTVTPGSPISVGASQTINIYIIPNTLTASGTTSRVENATFVTVTTTPTGGTPTKLAITSISPTSPTAGSGFNVTVQSQDGSSVATNVAANTGFTLSNTGGGTIGGTTTGTITAATNQVVVSGVTLSTAGTGVTLTATRTSGDTLTAGTSAAFNVLAAADHIAFVGVPATGAVNGPLTTFTVEARRPDNSVDTTYTTNVVITKASGSGTLSGTTTKPSVAGVATFNDLQFNAADTYTLFADSGSFSQITSGNIVVSDTTLASDFFRSLTTGDWGTAATWESSHDGSTNWITATLAPNNSANTITVRNGHTVTIAATVTYDQVTIDSGGQVTVASAVTHTLNNGAAATDLTINGTWLNQGGTWTTSGAWAVGAGGTFIHNSLGGIATPLGSATLDAASSFIYRGSSTLTTAPSVSGRTYGNLSFESTSGSYLPVSGAGGSPLTVNGSLSIGVTGAGTVSYSTTAFASAINVASGVAIGTGSALTLGSSTLTLTGGNWSNSGTFTPGTSTIAFTGASQQQYTRTGTGTLNNLTLNNNAGLLLNNDLTVNGVLTLTSGNITTGANTLTQGGTSSGNGDVIGNVARTDLGGTARSFGNPNNQISIQSGTAPTAMIVNLVKVTPSDFANAVTRTYTLTPTGGSGFSATVRLHYLDAELNGNTESTLNLWRKNGTWSNQGGTDTNGAGDANYVEASGITAFSPWAIAGPSGPTAVKLMNFTAKNNSGDVTLQWMSGYEAHNLGYIVYREVDGRRTAITPSLVAGSALTVGPQTVMGAGVSYSWNDKVSQSAKVSYWLEDVDIDGTRTLHGPIAPASVIGRKQRLTPSAMLNELQQRAPASGTIFRGWAGAADTQQAVQSDVSSLREEKSILSQGDIANLPGVKMGISKSGWYRVTRAELLATGFSIEDANRLQLYANGVEVPIKISGDGSLADNGDYLEFYGQGVDSPTDTAQTYYLVTADTAGKRIADPAVSEISGKPAGPLSYNYTIERRDRWIYYSAFLNGDEGNIFGHVVQGTPVAETLPASQVDSAGGDAQLEVSLVGLSLQGHHVRVSFNGVELGIIDFAGAGHPVASFNLAASQVREGDNTVQFVALDGSVDASLVDTVRLTYAHLYAADDSALAISLNNSNPRRITGFGDENVRVMDVTDPERVVELSPVVSLGNDRKYEAELQVVEASTANVRQLLVFASKGVGHPDSIRANEPSAWGSQPGADYLIITSREFKTNLEPLAQLRRNQGMVVSVIDVEDLYDEFTFGLHSPKAIHDFLETANSSWSRKPQYVLFAGDSSFDPKNYLGQGSTDFVPTKLFDTALMETASDDWLADFNNDGLADLSIGRLPIRTSADADLMVGKIISYENSAPDPKRGALLVADRNFEGASKLTQNVLPRSMTVQTINRSDSDDTTVHNKIIAGINQGPQVVNFVGHGGNGAWTGALLLSNADAASLTNSNRLSVFTMMTCMNGYFQNAYIDSLSEALMRARGGAVAVWSSTGMTVPDGQNLINQEFYRQVFGGSSPTLGDAVRAAKQATGDSDVRRTWILFGDPAMRLR